MKTKEFVERMEAYYGRRFSIDSHIEDEEEKKELEGRIISWYVDDLLSCGAIAERLKVSRSSVWKYLKRRGVELGSRVTIKCDYCGTEFKRVKSLIKGRARHFCNQDCYYGWVNKDNDYSPSKFGQRVGRAKVSKYFKLEDGMVVHHEDKNCTNNALWNLKVFKTNAEHIRYHRDGSGVPLWDGAKEHC